MSKNTKSNNKWIKEIKVSFYNILLYLNDNVKTINSSKIFAGLVVITLNIASRFVTIKISKSMESYLKFTFSRDVLVFCIVWMGSREIYMDSLLDEESTYCILPEKFTTYHTALLDGVPTEDEIKHAKHILEKASKI
jgi:hypothetical protein